MRSSDKFVKVERYFISSLLGLALLMKNSFKIILLLIEILDESSFDFFLACPSQFETCLLVKLVFSASSDNVFLDGYGLFSFALNHASSISILLS